MRFTAPLSRAVSIGILILFCGLSAADSLAVKPLPQTNRYANAISESRAAVREMMQRGSVPGVSVAVAVKGKVVWVEGFGYADIEQMVPVTPDTKFGIGSITKSLTMALFARLKEQGLVDFDSPVESYIPTFPHKGSGISARLIAGHLSGLDDSFSSANTYTSTHFNSTSESLEHILKEPLKHRPNEQHFYTTGPYTIIAGIIEKGGKQDFLAAMDEHVIRPLGLKNTVPNDRRKIILNRTSFYVRDENETVNAPYFDPSFKWAGAGYLSTAVDVAGFGAALLRPGFLKQETIDELFRPLHTRTGEDTGFGLGWRVGADKKNRRIIHQPGGGPGISCWIVLYPEHDLVVSILSNQTGAPVGGKALDTIIESFLAAKP